jgi:hypothetical protein
MSTDGEAANESGIADAAVHSGSVKLPDFWLSDTDMWFL